MKRSRKTFFHICTFLLGLGLGYWLHAKTRTVSHLAKCHDTVYLVSDNRKRPQTLEQEVERNSGLLLVGVLVNTKEDENIIYDDFSTETNIKFTFFTTSKNISLNNRRIIYLGGFNASTEPNSVKYLRMFIHVSQQYGNKFNWFMFTENSYFVNMDKLKFLKNLHHSEPEEFLFLPQYRYEPQDSSDKSKDSEDIVHAIQPGMILSRLLLQRISNVTESCLNKRHGLRECLQKTVSISWITDFQVFEILFTRHKFHTLIIVTATRVSHTEMRKMK